MACERHSRVGFALALAGVVCGAFPLVDLGCRTPENLVFLSPGRSLSFARTRATMNRPMTRTASDIHLSIQDFGTANRRGERAIPRAFFLVIDNVQLPITQRGFFFSTSTESQKGDIMRNRTLAIEVERVLFRLIEARQAIEVEHNAKLKALGRLTTRKEIS